MSIFTVLSDNRFARKVGRTLLRYFDSKDFSEELLLDKVLNELHKEAQFRKIDADKTLTEAEAFERMLAVYGAYVKRLKKSGSFDEK